jgi:hypothetical protein
MFDRSRDALWPIGDPKVMDDQADLCIPFPENWFLPSAIGRASRRVELQLNHIVFVSLLVRRSFRLQLFMEKRRRR